MNGADARKAHRLFLLPGSKCESKWAGEMTGIAPELLVIEVTVKDRLSATDAHGVLRVRRLRIEKLSVAQYDVGRSSAVPFRLRAPKRIMYKILHILCGTGGHYGYFC